MSDDRPFTKEDGTHLADTLEKLMNAKLETMSERITGLRNWGVGVVAAATLLAGSTFATHTPPTQQAKTAIAVLTRIL